MGRRNGRSGAGGMKQLGAVHGDKDDFRPSSGRGRGGGGGGRGSGGRSIADRSGKYMDRQAAGNMAYTRQIPKFLKQFSHLLGEEKKPSMSASEHGEAVEKAFLASKDRQDEAPTIVNEDEFANDKRYAKQLKSLVGGGGDDVEASSPNDSSGSSKKNKEAKGVSSAMERLKALGMKIPAKRKIENDDGKGSAAKTAVSSKSSPSSSSSSSSSRGMGYLLGKIADLEGRIERRMEDGRVKEANEFTHEKNKLQAEVRRLRQQKNQAASRDQAARDNDDDRPSAKKGRKKKKSKTKR